jgi:hypothetical protein
MKTRTDLLNHLAGKYNLQTYLEIGVQVPEINFDKIKCKYKSSVDPDPKANAMYQMTSDKFFTHWIYDGTFDLIFIDGLHTAEQVKKDFENALKILSPNGFIVLHDCNPEKEEHTIIPRPSARGHWNGDVYRFAVMLTNRAFAIHPAYTVDIDNGMTVFSVKEAGYYLADNEEIEIPVMEWLNFNENRKEALNLITWDEFIAIGSHV